MQCNSRVRGAFAGGILFGAFGSALGGLVIGAIGFFSQILPALRSSPAAAVGALGLLSLCMLVAMVFAGPFGLVAGAVFGWWQVGRATSGISKQRLLRESAAMGTGIGAAYPLFFNTVYPALDPKMEKLHAGPALLFLAVGAGVGMLCGVALARMARAQAAPIAD